MDYNSYLCRICGEKWNFVPEDYEDSKDYPDQCPLCTMPITEMISDVFHEEGIIGVIVMLYKRLRLKI